VIRAAFVRPKVEKYWMGWPGAAYDIKARQLQYTEALNTAAAKFGIDLKLISTPLHNADTVNAFVETLNKDKPDGVLIVSMCLHDPGFRSWGQLNNIAKNKGQVPMVAFSPMGTSFTNEVHGTRYPELRKDGVFVGATQDVEWLNTGMRMLNTVHQMKNTRLLIVKGDKVSDRKLDVIGTTLHYVPRSRWPEEFHKTEITDEMRAIANYYTRKAKKIVEPNKHDILNAAKNYVVARRLMTAEKCHGISALKFPVRPASPGCALTTKAPSAAARPTGTPPSLCGSPLFFSTAPALCRTPRRTPFATRSTALTAPVRQSLMALTNAPHLSFCAITRSRNWEFRPRCSGVSARRSP
jgi:hypothetical protein